MYSEIDGNEELELVLISILEDGAKKPSEIAEDTDIPVKRVYELRRKLGDRLQKVQKRMAAQLKQEGK